MRNLVMGRYVLACAFFASLNSVLLGYDVGVMSGAIIFIQEDLMITEVQKEVLVGCLSIVSLFGSLAGGIASDANGGTTPCRDWYRLRSNDCSSVYSRDITCCL
ncbi:hypothetical protein Droror1_Dr00005317 [Drosera rotundifolia]